MTQEEFNLRLEENKRKEAAIAASLPLAGDDEIPELLQEFIACKYFLDPEDFTTEELLPLGEKSTAKMAGFQKKGIQFKEKSAGCTTASSGIIKKILLAMAIGKIIGIKLNPDDVAEAETISQLAEMIIKARKE